MKKYIHQCLLAIVALMMAQTLHAQEDVSATYLVNPGFEQGPSFFHDDAVTIPGWNISAANLTDAFLNQNDGEKAPQGTNVFGLWSPGSVGDFEISQTVHGLPEGTYTIRCAMTTTRTEYTTQRMFASTQTSGTKALYYQSSPLDTIDGETAYFAGYPDDGNGNGPFRTMLLKVKINKGESLTFGIRTNGTQSVVSPRLATLGKNGNFKVDHFVLSYIVDDVAYTKALIQAKIDFLNTYLQDSLPVSYVAFLTEKVAWGNKEIATQTTIDSLEWCLTNITELLPTLNTAKAKFVALEEKIRFFKEEIELMNLANYSNLPYRAEVYAAYQHALDVSKSRFSLISDFEKSIAQLNAIMLQLSFVGVVPFGLGDNQALNSTVSTSYVTPGLNLSAVKDGFQPNSSSDSLHSIYGNWRGTQDNGKTDWIEYEWPEFYVFSSAYVYWYSDTGRMSQPVAATLEYWQGNEWKTAGAIDTALNKWNVLKLDELSTKKMRLSFHSPTSTGICEFGAVGFLNTSADSLVSMVNRRLASINGIHPDSLPKGYLPLIETFRQKCDLVFAHKMASYELYHFLPLYSNLLYSLDSAHVAFHRLALWKDSAQQLLAGTNFQNKGLLQNAYDNACAVNDASTSLLPDYNASILALRNAVETYMMTGLVTENDVRVSVYPNPVKNHLIVDFGSLVNGSVRITNVLGQTVYHAPAKSQKVEIDVTKFAANSQYLLQLYDSQNRLIEAKKILKY